MHNKLAVLPWIPSPPNTFPRLSGPINARGTAHLFRLFYPSPLRIVGQSLQLGAFRASGKRVVFLIASPSLSSPAPLFSVHSLCSSRLLPDDEENDDDPKLGEIACSQFSVSITLSLLCPLFELCRFSHWGGKRSGLCLLEGTFLETPPIKFALIFD